MNKLVILLIALFGVITASELSCKDPNGNTVDWFLALKMPSNFNQGRQFLYWDAKDDGKNYKLHDNIQDQKTSPLMNTLKQIKKVKSDDHFSIFWNDQPTSGHASASYAHSKGAAAGNKERGFLLTHSIPKFVQFTEDNEEILLAINDSQTKYGQHILCISMDAFDLSQYGNSLLIDRAYVFEQSYMPESLKEDYFYWNEVMNNKNRVVATTDVLEFYSTSGQMFKKFAKSYKWQDCLYTKVVAQEYKTNMIFETWGRPLQDPHCDEDYTVQANLYVKYSDELQYKYTKDHSKFGIGLDNQGIICFGDINRMTSQYKRGGGTTCFANKHINSFLKKSMTEQQECQAPLTFFQKIFGL